VVILARRSGSRSCRSLPDGTITPAQVQQMLGLRSRWETEAFLRKAEPYHD
jgi:hypothetical protein